MRLAREEKVEARKNLLTENLAAFHGQLHGDVVDIHGVEPPRVRVDAHELKKASDLLRGHIHGVSVRLLVP